MSQPTHRTPLRRLPWAAAGLGCVAFLAAIALAVGRPSNGFVAYYTSARLLSEGESAVCFYDDQWFRSQVHRFEPRVSEIYNANTPVMALLLLPLAWLPYAAARASWVPFGAAVLGRVSGHARS